jgi:MFS family permease
MFIFGGLPALMIFFIRYGVHESKRWHEKFGQSTAKRPTMAQAFGALFTPRYKRDTLVMSGLFLVSIIMLWAGSVYVPTAARQMAAAAGETVEANLARVATYASIVLAVGTIIGCVLVPIFAERIGRRATMALFMTVLGVSAALGFGYVFYVPDALGLFMFLTFFMGLGGANFAVYTVWLPELYTTDCRASAIGFISSAGRFVGMAMVFLLYYGIPRYGSLGVPVALVALTFVLGLLLLPFARETKGQALPA